MVRFQKLPIVIKKRTINNFHTNASNDFVNDTFVTIAH